MAYVPFGASYESGSMDHSNFGAFKTNVTDGRVTFTTGTYTPNGKPLWRKTAGRSGPTTTSGAEG